MSKEKWTFQYKLKLTIIKATRCTVNVNINVTLTANLLHVCDPEYQAAASVALMTTSTGTRSATASLDALIVRRIPLPAYGVWGKDRLFQLEFLPHLWIKAKKWARTNCNTATQRVSAILLISLVPAPIPLRFCGFAKKYSNCNMERLERSLH